MEKASLACSTQASTAWISYSIMLCVWYCKRSVLWGVKLGSEKACQSLIFNYVHVGPILHPCIQWIPYLLFSVPGDGSTIRSAEFPCVVDPVLYVIKPCTDCCIGRGHKRENASLGLLSMGIVAPCVLKPSSTSHFNLFLCRPQPGHSCRVWKASMCLALYTL